MNSYYFETRNNPLFLQEDKNICLPGKAGQQTYQHGDRGSEMQPKFFLVSQTDLSNGITGLGLVASDLRCNCVFPSIKWGTLK